MKYIDWIEQWKKEMENKYPLNRGSSKIIGYIQE